MFVGHSTMTKGYRMIDTTTNKLVVVRTAVFEESTKIKYVQVMDRHLGQHAPLINNDIEKEETHQPPSAQLDVVTRLIWMLKIVLLQGICAIRLTMVLSEWRYDDGTFGNDTNPRLHQLVGNPQLALPDGDPFGAIVSDKSRSIENNEQPKKRYILEDEEANAALKVPSCYQGIRKSPEAKQWLEAIKAELAGLEEKSTWTVVTNSPSQKVIGTKGFQLKNDKGEIQRYKARLLALG
uniref:AlNc14C497G11929 protein n=1 Tax=Albugo laibachii Nc14 TaxID=890382 RepID=F0X0I5_9STRA|nr:AlNc14C497G11929 [Albugo laibachii Nc14]|eukprot:CCA27275.1 AlNc14C497G11929 [Albugo laibachii Nc14]